LIAIIAVVWGYLLYADRPVRQTEYLNIPLGVSKEEVLYRLGEPTTVFREQTEGKKKAAPDEDKDDLIVANRDGKFLEGNTAKDYDYWSWEKKYEPLSLIAFDNNAVVRIVCYAEEGTWCPSLVEIASGYSEEQVLAKLVVPA
jgi:hypothetical protein